MVADGSAVLFADGSGFMTNQYNGFGDKQTYETYWVTFGEGTANEIINDNVLVVYPNPTVGELFVSEKLVNVRLMDVAGRVVYEVSEVVNSIDLSGLASGTYIFTAEKEGNRINTKVIVR